MFPLKRSAYPLWGRELGSWTPALVVWFSLLWLRVPSSGPWLRAPGLLQSLSEQTTWRQKRGESRESQIKAYFLTCCRWFITDLLLALWRGRSKTAEQDREDWFFSMLYFFFTFSIDLNFSWADMFCNSPLTPTVLNSSGSNTSRAQPINHQGVWQTNHLLMK